MFRPHRRLATGLALVLAVGAVAFGGAACGGSDDDSSDATTEVDTVTEAPTTDVETATDSDTTTEVETETEVDTVTEADTVTEQAGGDVAAGQMVFNQTCTTCHAENGEGQGPVGPNLAGEGLSQEDIEDVITNGRGGMPGGLVSGEQFDDVVVYVERIQ